MEVVSAHPQSTDVLLAARQRIRNGPVPPWATPTDFRADFTPAQPDFATFLLISQQIHAELHQTHVRVVQRLENMQGVQELSQWRLPFEPLTMSVTVHWIKIRRGALEVDQGFTEKFRLLQREERLEGCIIDGWITLLLLLEDVRPGDVLDACYTLERMPRFLPENCSCFFSLPRHQPVGKFHFSLRFKADRPMKWKSSAPEVRPSVESLATDTLAWSWCDEDYEPGKPEENIPDWFPAYPWLQFSDCPDWGKVSTAISNGWKRELDDPAVGQLVKEIEGTTTDSLERIEKAIRLIQDEFRYLSVNVELGGQIPSPPSDVVRRRFGDCKDLSFLLVHMLQRLGVPARPVLVDTMLRKTVAGLLPTPHLFNHVLVEYQIQDQRHWVDATLKHQGGSVLNTFIPDFGVGLPVDPNCSQLIDSPKRPLQADLYELKETILLDTAGEASLMCVLLRAKGCYAEHLRNQLEEKGEEEFAKDRLEVCASRFLSATRSGSLLHRDDRAANEFILTEVYEINGLLIPHEDQGYCRFVFPGTLLSSTLIMPEPRSRKTPFALPHPCNVLHTVEVQSPALKLVTSPRSRIATPFVQFTRVQKSLSSYCSVTCSLSTLADSVPPERIEEHKEAVERIWKESTWEINLEQGYSRPRRRSDFGELPLPQHRPGSVLARLGHPSRAVVPQNKQEDAGKPHFTEAMPRARDIMGAGTSQLTKPSFDKTPRPRSQTRRSKKNKKEENLLWPILITAIIIVLLGLFVLASKPPTR